MILRILYILLWFFISPFVLPVACYKGRSRLWDWAFYFDNEEDGYDGSKGGFYSEYLGYDIKAQNWLKRSWIAYKWSLWRNPCWNLRYHPSIGVNITEPKNLVFEGNTLHHDAKWSFEPNKKETKWYKLTATYEGKEYTSRFYLIPIFSSKYSLYIRFGLKIYPGNYLDPWWLGKIEKEGWPKHKDKGILAFTFRIR